MLTQAQFDALARESRASGVSKSKIVRRALEDALGVEDPMRVRGVELKLGIWRDPDGAAVGRRLARLRFRRKR
jgi:hypothetical protein